MVFVRPSVCLFVRPSGTGVHCDHTVQFSADLSLWLHSPFSDTREYRALTPSHLFPRPPGKEVGYGCAN